jgi:DNA-binding MurR/RpiR family transcriptional regulator
VYCEREYCRKAAATAASRRYRAANRREPDRSRRQVSKLATEEREEIKQTLANIEGPLSAIVPKLARKYKVSPSTIYRQAKTATKTAPLPTPAEIT